MTHRVLLYDFNPTGHCPGWLFLVATGFRVAGAEVRVCCRTDDPRLDVWVEKMRVAGCTMVGIPEVVEDHATHADAEARSHDISRIFFPNFDSVVYEMGKLGVAGVFAGMDIGGIWLRPDIRGEEPKWWERLRRKWLRTRANKLARKHWRAVRNNRRGLDAVVPGTSGVGRIRLFFASSEAAMELSSRLGDDGVALICDPWLERATITKAEARAALGIDPGRRVFLHTGTSRPEKGLKDACEALLGLGPEVRGNACLLRAGVVDPLDAGALRALDAAGAAVVLDRYVSEEELAMCYVAADWVLLPYRDQKETSGVLVHAAANRRPVIASDFGVIGRHVRRYALGRSFTHRDVGSLRSLLGEVISSPGDFSCDVTGMEEFSNLNSPDAFRATLNEQWLLSPPDDREGLR